MENNIWVVRIISLIIYGLIFASLCKIYSEKSFEKQRLDVSNSKEYSQVIALIKEKNLSMSKIKSVTENTDRNYWFYFFGFIGSFITFNTPYAFIRSIIQYFFNNKAQSLNI